MKYIVIPVILIALLSCKSNIYVSENKTQPSDSLSLKIEMPEQIKAGLTLKIKISTNHDEGIVLYDPMLLRVERFENNEWLRVRILHCPCGANCIPPPRERMITKSENWFMSWNLVESWCENEKGREIPETIELPAVPGKYRSVFYYGYNVKERIKITKEFQIIN